MTRKTKCKYMHTMDGRPAVWDRDGLYFSSDVTLVKDLRTIRNQQQAQKAAWRKMGETKDPLRLGYVRVKVD